MMWLFLTNYESDLQVMSEMFYNLYKMFGLFDHKNYANTVKQFHLQQRTNFTLAKQVRLHHFTLTAWV